MSIYYFDTSAILKRYTPEPGTAWVRQLCSIRDQKTQAALHVILLSEISRVEVAAALTQKARKTREISQPNADTAYALFLKHIESDYRLIALTSAVIRSAASVAQTHALRAYDAVQLASALEANRSLEENDLSLVFVASDKILLQAAKAEGLGTENPHD